MQGRGLSYPDGLAAGRREVKVGKTDEDTHGYCWQCGEFRSTVYLGAICEPCYDAWSPAEPVRRAA
jgi:hypothetical protein